MTKLRLMKDFSKVRAEYQRILVHARYFYFFVSILLAICVDIKWYK